MHITDIQFHKENYHGQQNLKSGKKSNQTNPNTDGIINGLVMIFAKPCSHDRSGHILHPNTSTCPHFKSCAV